MQGDENTIELLVVEDGASSKEESLKHVKMDKVFSVNDKDPAQTPYPITFKIEHMDGSTTHDSENNDIKEEQNTHEYEIEFLEELPLEYDHDSDQNYKIDDEEDDQDESSDYEYQNTSKKIGTVKRKPPPRTTQKRKVGRRKTCQAKKSQNKLNNHKRVKWTQKVSYVQQLRDENPELDEDEEKLIKHLATLMRDTVPPAPPDNYCIEIMTDKDTKKYKCSYCGDQAATTEAAAARHYQYKHGEYYLNCYACGFPQKDPWNLYRHEKRCRALDSEIVLRARGLYLGRKARSRPFFVNTKFVTKNTLPKQKGFFCSKCTASFAHLENLKAHEKSHEGLRPHRCPHCSNSFASYMQYKHHMKKHGDYQCIYDHCAKKFKLRSAFVSHLETHQLRKNSCASRFAGRIDCEHHMNKMYPEQPAVHGCPVCPKRYAKMCHVQEHMSRKHGLVMMTAKMFWRAMPKLTDQEIERTRKLFKFATNSTVSKPDVVMRQPEQTLLDLSESDQQEVPMFTKIVKIIKKKKAQLDECHDPEEIYYDSENAGHEPEDVSHDPEDVDHDPEDVGHETEETDYEQDYPVEYLEEIEDLEEEQEDKKVEKPRPNKKKPRRLKTGSLIKIDEEIEKGDMHNIEYKRKRRIANPTTETKQIDEDKNLRDMKSTLTKRKKNEILKQKRKSIISTKPNVSF